MNNSTLINYLTVMVLLGLMTWYVIRFIKRHQTNENESNTGDTQLYGIGGFLDLIIFWKAAVAPLLAVYAIANQLFATEELPGFVASREWDSYKTYYIMALVAVQLANWFVAYGLAYRFTAASGRNAKILFFITPLVPLVQYFVGKSLLGFSSATNVLIEFAASFALSILFFSYFTLSARIKDLYYTVPDKNAKKDPAPNSGFGNTLPKTFNNTANSAVTNTAGATIYSLVKPVPVYSELKKCPYCAEDIRPDAVKCRYCLSELTEVQS